MEPANPHAHEDTKSDISDMLNEVPDIPGHLPIWLRNAILDYHQSLRNYNRGIRIATMTAVAVLNDKRENATVIEAHGRLTIQYQDDRLIITQSDSVIGQLQRRLRECDGAIVNGSGGILGQLQIGLRECISFVAPNSGDMQERLEALINTGLIRLYNNQETMGLPLQRFLINGEAVLPSPVLTTLHDGRISVDYLPIPDLHTSTWIVLNAFYPNASREEINAMLNVLFPEQVNPAIQQPPQPQPAQQQPQRPQSAQQPQPAQRQPQQPQPAQEQSQQPQPAQQQPQQPQPAQRQPQDRLNPYVNQGVNPYNNGEENFIKDDISEGDTKKSTTLPNNGNERFKGGKIQR